MRFAVFLTAILLLYLTFQSITDRTWSFAILAIAFASAALLDRFLPPQPPPR